jgi:hypothetical protein
MSTEDELIAEGLLGDAAKEFKESELGRCLLGMAEQESMKALEDLALHDCEDAKGIERLQNRVALGRMLGAYIEELITNGDNAITLYKAKQDES